MWYQLYLPSVCTAQLCARICIDDNVSISKQIQDIEHYGASVGDDFDDKMNKFKYGASVGYDIDSKMN